MLTGCGSRRLQGQLGTSQTPCTQSKSQCQEKGSAKVGDGLPSRGIPYRHSTSPQALPVSAMDVDQNREGCAAQRGISRVSTLPTPSPPPPPLTFRRVRGKIDVQLLPIPVAIGDVQQGLHAGPGPFGS